MPTEGSGKSSHWGDGREIAECTHGTAVHFGIKKHHQLIHFICGIKKQDHESNEQDSRLHLCTRQLTGVQL